MPHAQVAFVTMANYNASWVDDQLAEAPLAMRDIALEFPIWNDPSVEWTKYDLIVLRSPWDYDLDPQAFRGWLNRAKTEGWPLWNPVELVEWNFAKGYLKEFEARGIPVIPTRWISSGVHVDLATIQRETGWNNLVIKPRVSAGARGLWSIEGPATDEQQTRFEQQLAEKDLLVQPLITQIAEGERSFVFFRHPHEPGRFSHALIKTPVPGDIRVQYHYGGTFAAFTPTQVELAWAERVLAAIDSDWLYARVDGVPMDGSLALIELELFEPVLYLQTDAGSAERFAEAIGVRLGAGYTP